MNLNLSKEVSWSKSKKLIGSSTSEGSLKPWNYNTNVRIIGPCLNVTEVFRITDVLSLALDKELPEKILYNLKKDSNAGLLCFLHSFCFEKE